MFLPKLSVSNGKLWWDKQDGHSTPQSWDLGAINTLTYCPVSTGTFAEFRVNFHRNADSKPFQILTINGDTLAAMLDLIRTHNPKTIIYKYEMPPI